MAKTVNNSIFKGSTMQEKKEELQKMNYIPHLEEVGRVYVDDLSMNDIETMIEVLDDLGYPCYFEGYKRGKDLGYLVLESK